MENGDYVQNLRIAEQSLQQAMMFLHMLSDSALKEMQDTVERADSVGFIVDPTKYREALQDGRLDYQRHLLKWCVHTVAEAKVLMTMQARMQTVTKTRELLMEQPSSSERKADG